MSRKKLKDKNTEVSYWEAMADNMTALLLAILLILMLLMMYLVNIPEDIHVDDDLGNSTGRYMYQGDDQDNENSRGFQTDYEDGEEDEDGRGGSRGGGGGGRGEDEEGIDPDIGDGEGDNGNKSAVQVQIVDEETGNTVKMSDVTFELYHGNGLMTLCTYYPTRIEYTRYKTQKDGTFFLPEKLAMDTLFSLHPVMTIEGYDLPDSTDFVVYDSRDWNDPFLVLVVLSPEKNVIRIQLNDEETNKAVSEAKFQVIASENITTKDGTVRYKAGDIVDVLSVDETGYGESRELYLGKYHLEQIQTAEYYAKLIENPEIQLKKKGKAKGSVQQLQEPKTSMNIRLTDELFTSSGIENAAFAVTANNAKSKTYTTDSHGDIKLEDLKKNTTYRIEQKSSSGEYQFQTKPTSFTVDGSGLIDGEAAGELTITNRMIRVSVSIIDKIFRGEISDINMGLRNSDGKVVETWNSTGLEKTIEGLKPGNYEILLNGRENNTFHLTVEDTGEIQSFTIEQWSIADFGFIVGSLVIGIGLFILIGFLLKRRKAENNGGKKK